jgi:hypothetical protein
MSHPWEGTAKFWQRLVEWDEQVAEKIRKMGCQHCGGPLHRADYPRKPRGELGEAEEAFCRRRSFCCGHCRRRATPPSVRFLGRKVYVGQLVVVACVVFQELRGAVGKRVGIVPRRTVRRWMTWWRETMPGTSFWRVARGLFMPPVRASELPRSLLLRFGDGLVGLARMLSFVAPLTTRSAGSVRVDVSHAEDGAW